MNQRVFLVFSAVALCFISAQALQCYDCKIGFFDLCLTTKVTCENTQHCFSGMGKAAGFLDIKMKGCLNVDKCNKTESYTFTQNSVLYNLTRTCCSTDLCNSAPGGAHVSAVTMLLAAAVITIQLIM